MMKQPEKMSERELESWAEFHLKTAAMFEARLGRP